MDKMDVDSFHENECSDISIKINSNSVKYDLISEKQFYKQIQYIID